MSLYYPKYNINHENIINNDIIDCVDKINDLNDINDDINIHEIYNIIYYLIHKFLTYDNTLLLLAKIEKLIEENIVELSRIHNDYIDIDYVFGFYYYHIKNKFNISKKYYKLSANRGNINSINNLGIIYMMIDKNYEMALKYFMIIEQNNNISQYNIGMLYLDMKDYKNAYKYLKKSINNNNIRAIYDMRQFKILHDKFEEKESNNICIICYNNTSDMCCKQCKNYYFCFNCIFKWILTGNGCPICRS